MQASHPFLTQVGSLSSMLRETEHFEPSFLTTDERRALLTSLGDLRNRLAALHLRVIAASTDVATQEGHRDLAAWLTHRTRAWASDNRRTVRLAVALDERWHATALALTGGALSLDQAHVITRGLDDLQRAFRSHDADRCADTEILARAEEHLIAQAAHFGPRELRQIAAKVLCVVAPDVAEEHERIRLEAGDRWAAEVTCLTTRPLGDGTTLIRGRVADAVAERLTTYLEAFTSPRRHVPSTPSRERHDVRLGHAFGALLETLDPQRLPLHGGDATRVVVTIGLDDLRRGLSGLLPSGEAISGAQARRLACTSEIVPVVLGRDSEILDLGRTARLFSPAQRRALAVRDRGCRADGCDIPATWTEAHHLEPWSHGGLTDLSNALLLCSHHHHRIHDGRYAHQRLPSGEVRFTRCR